MPETKLNPIVAPTGSRKPRAGAAAPLPQTPQSKAALREAAGRIGETIVTPAMAINKAIELARTARVVFASGAADKRAGAMTVLKGKVVAGFKKAAQGHRVPSPLGEEELDTLVSRLQTKLLDAGIANRTKMRFRPPQGKEKRYNVEFFPDPGHKGVVFLRLAPASAVDDDEDASEVNAPEPERTVTTTEVAELLQYSRPYAAKLCDSGVFGPVERSQGGHRRVSFDRVLAYKQERREMSTALDEMADLTQDARQVDASQAVATRQASGKVWVKKKAATTK